MSVSCPAVGLVVWLVCLPLLMVAAWHDMIARTIPNWVPATLALVGAAAFACSPVAWGDLLPAALMFGGALLLWRLGWLGGGDAKLVGAVGLLVPPARIGVALTVTALAGFVLALPYLACRGRIARPAHARPSGLALRAWRAERFRLRRGGPLPYAVAIAVGMACGLLGGPS